MGKQIKNKQKKIIPYKVYYPINEKTKVTKLHKLLDEEYNTKDIKEYPKIEQKIQRFLATKKGEKELAFLSSFKGAKILKDFSGLKDFSPLILGAFKKYPKIFEENPSKKTINQFLGRIIKKVPNSKKAIKEEIKNSFEEFEKKVPNSELTLEEFDKFFKKGPKLSEVIARGLKQNEKKK